MASRETMKKFLILPGLILGGAVFLFFVKNKDLPEQQPLMERSTVVRVVPATELSLVPRALGYGFVQPGKEWRALAEVSGKVVEMHPDLSAGSILPQGAFLFRIDPEKYDLAQAGSQADVAGLEAQIRELERTAQNLAVNLETEKRAYELSVKELNRIRELYSRGNASRSQMDQTEKNVLAQKARVQNLENSLRLLPAQKAALEARLASGQARAEGSRLDLAKTEIRAPFDCRISGVNVELNQFAPAGQVLASAYDLSSSEVLAQFPLAAVFQLMPTDAKGVPTLIEIDMDKLRKRFNISAQVRMEIAPGYFAVWPGELSRISEMIDPQTRTLGVVVLVRDTYKQARLGERPPLVKNMYVQVELRGQPWPEQMVIPRSALRGSEVLVCDGENRLRRRPVTVRYRQGRVVAVSKGLEPGDKVVVSDLNPAIEGELLVPEIDQALLDRTLAEAQGEGDVQ